MKKSKNQIAKDIMALVKGWINVNYPSFGVRQGEQPLIQSMNVPFLTFFEVYNRRYGWQFRKDYMDEMGNLVHDESYFLEFMYQFSFFKKRIASDIDELTATDCANDLLTYINSIDGINDFRAMGYGFSRTSNISEDVFEDSSNNIQIQARFDIVFMTKQTITTPQDEIKSFITEIEPIN